MSTYNQRRRGPRRQHKARSPTSRRSGNEGAGIWSAAGADNVVVHQGPLDEGAASHGPYDVIILEGAVEELPQTISDQLKEGGRIACLFQEGALGTMRLGYKVDGAISWRFSFNASAPVLPGFTSKRAFALSLT